MASKKKSVFSSLIEVRQRQVDAHSEELRRRRNQEKQAERNRRLAEDRERHQQERTEEERAREMALVDAGQVSAGDVQMQQSWETARHRELERLRGQTAAAQEKLRDARKASERTVAQLAHARAEHKAVERYQQRVEAEHRKKQEQAAEDEALDLVTARWTQQKC